jgi:hypothetical protein
VYKFLFRNKLSRRKITSTPKSPSSFDTSHIQQAIVKEGYHADEILNADETSIMLNPGSHYVYMPKSTRRTHGVSEDENHLLTLLITVASSGKLLPAFYIVKNNCLGSDHRSGRVLHNLKRNFADGESLDILLWEREVHGVQHFRWYLQHKYNYSVVVCNSKAFMDQVTLLEFIDVLFAPFLKGRRSLLIWDNCAVHNVQEVRSALQAINVRVELLPPNTTPNLQPLDVYLNGQLKRILREKKAHDTFRYMIQWRYECMSGELEKSTTKFCNCEINNP